MIFSVENGNFGYGKNKEILHDISFPLREGEVLSVLGPNGVGKTTLLRCMMGLLKWKSGGSFVDGKNIETFDARTLWQKIAYVPQAKGVAFAYTVEEMVLLGRSSYIGTIRQPTKKDMDICHEKMNMIGIYHLKDKFCNQISGGELQMALIARALCANPSMLILDEPESNLDFHNQLIILNLIERLSKEQGISCIFNTHYPVHALKISDYSLVLAKDGSTTFGVTGGVINRERMREVFQVDVHINDVTYGDLQYQTVTALYIV